MTTFGPWRPSEESLEQYLDRLVHRAPVPTSEQSAQLAGWIRLGQERRPGHA